MPNIVVLDGYTVNPGDNPWDPLERIASLTVFDRSSPDQVVERAAAADVVLVNKAQLSRAVLEQLPRLKGVSVLATGVNSVDLECASERGIPVCNVPSYSTRAVAQHTIALLLELCHHVGVHDESVHAGEWQRSVDYCYWMTPLLELEGKMLGIVGFGAIGQQVALVARALGMEVCAAVLNSKTSGSTAAVPRLELDALFAAADVVSLHCPLTDRTRGLVSEQRLRSMKPTSFLLNTARGGLIDEAALRVALDARVIAGAALDVLSSEPPHPNNVLLAAPRCIITPHFAWTSLNARKRLLDTSVENVRGILSGTPVHVVNPAYRSHAE